MPIQPDMETEIFVAFFYYHRCFKLFKFQNGSVSNYNMGLIILPLFKADIFIETGTYRAESLQVAIDSGFYSEFHSIDVDEELISKAQAKYAKQENVHIYLGTSPDILREILPNLLNKTILFWLDAHFQGISKTELDLKYGECPLLEELKVIKELAPHSIIFIDDAFMFGESFWTTAPHAHLFKRDQWPTIKEIEDSLQSTHILSLNGNIIYCLPKFQQ